MHKAKHKPALFIRVVFLEVSTYVVSIMLPAAVSFADAMPSQLYL